MKVSTTLLLLAGLWQLIAATDFPKPSEDFTHYSVLDSKDNYYLYWKYDNVSVTFEVHVRTKGFVGFGISPNGGMVGADVVVGWVNNGQAFLQDRHTKGKFEPIIDKKQDWTLIAGHETPSFTVLKFKRDFDTCDDDQDLKITTGTTKLIFAWGPNEPTTGTRINYHGLNRGTKSVLLLSPVLPEPQMPSNLYSYDFLAPKNNVPSERTTYWCTAMKFPKFDKKHHLIKYEPVVTPGNEGIVHHILVYGCYHDVDIKHHGVTGNCGTQAMPNELLMCRSIVLAWAIGGTAYNYPEHVGWPMGMNDDPTFLMMEIHYDNPMGRSDIIDNSGLRIYYTPELRQFDSGLLEVGLAVTPAHMIPPNYEQFVNTGYCYGECTKEAWNKDGIKIFTALPHEHLLGSAVRTKVIRNGEEVAVVSEDMAYDFNFQEYRHLPEEINVYPGDELVTECHYKSIGRQSITHGGLGTTEEMCLSFLLYYPKTDLAKCISTPEYSTPLWGSEWAGKNIYEVVYSEDWSNSTKRERFQGIVTQSENYAECEKNGGIRYKATARGQKPIQISKSISPPQSNCPKN